MKIYDINVGIGNLRILESHFKWCSIHENFVKLMKVRGELKCRDLKKNFFFDHPAWGCCWVGKLLLFLVIYAAICREAEL